MSRLFEVYLKIVLCYNTTLEQEIGRRNMIESLVDAIINYDIIEQIEISKKELKADEAHVKFLEMSAYENNFFARGKRFIAGVDEAGRGPLAGPVVAAAVILPDNFYLPGLNNSKKMTKKQRERLYKAIISTCQYGIGIGTVEEIDRMNILETTKRAMIRAIQNLNVVPDQLLVDAVTIPIDIPQIAIVKGDARSISIAAASIIAKVTRDHYMEKLHEQYPKYGFNRHNGYGTKAHLEAIDQFGITPEHRKTFEPVRSKLLKRTTLFDFMD